MIHGQQNRRTGQVFVQQVVMNDLEMPEPFSGGGVQRENTVCEQVLPMTFASVKIGFSRLGRDVDDAAILIEGSVAGTAAEEMTWGRLKSAFK